MRRRDFIAALGGTAAAWPLAARAQQPKVPVVGYLNALGADQATNLAGFLQGLAESGYIEGQNVAIEYRYADGRYDRLLTLAEELVHRQVDVIATTGGSPSAKAAMAATSTIPIVFTVGDVDPVDAGLVAKISRPGGNITGLSLLGGILAAKRLEILRTLAPHAATIAILVNPSNRNAEANLKEVEAAMQAAGQRLIVLRAKDSDGFQAAFTTLVDEHADALVVTADGIFTNGRAQLTALAAQNRIPAIYQWREFVRSGGLVSYGASLMDSRRQMGLYVGRILKGAKPADLPVLQPTKFELAINLKAAKALGLEIPPMLLAIADEVIE